MESVALSEDPLSPVAKPVGKDHAAPSSSSSTTPPAVVITASNSHSIELGLLLSLGVLCMYFYGCWESIQALPEVSLVVPDHPGSNMNLANNHELLSPYDPPAEAAANVAARHLADDSEPTPKVNNKHVTFSAGKGNLNIPPNHVNNHVMNDITPKVPPAQWPVSALTNNEHDFETILHPGDDTKTMSVPKFWAPPIHQNKLMTRSEAMTIGSCIESDKDGNYARGDDCPLHQRTIFLAIASYRDFQCRYTLESAFLRAKYPERLRVGVVDQIVDGEDPKCDSPIEPCDKNPHQALCMYKDQVDVYQMEAGMSVGPVFARHIGHRLYRGEYYATQNDAHITYVQDWDIDIVGQFESLHNDMAVLTTYLTDVQESIDDQGHSLRHTRPIMCNTYYEGGQQGMHLRHGSQPEGKPKITGTPQMQPYWAAGYSFSRGHFVVNVPYDLYQPMIFQGEEMSIGIRAFTVGYDMYAFERSVCFHHYAVGKNAKKRNKVKHFWENGQKYAGVGKKAMSRLLGIVNMNPETDRSTWDHTDENIYGLGGVRTPEKFYETFGIDVVNKKTEGHLCRFVDWGGKMHKDFSKHLRKDGMGINYDEITYKFKDPAPGQK